MSGVNYDVTIHPTPVVVKVQVSIDVAATQLKAEIKDIPSVTVDFKPADDSSIGEKIMSGLVWPLAELLGHTVAGEIIESIGEGQTFDVAKIPEIAIDYDPVHVTLKPNNLSLSNYQGKLLLMGDVDFA